MVNEILKAKIKAWVTRDLAGYMRECASGYWTYMRGDWVGEFAPDGPEEAKEDVCDYITAVLLEDGES